MQKSLIIIPTYNEAGNIVPLVQGIFSYLPYAHLLFVDDNSSDGTQKIVGDLQASHKDQIFLLARTHKQGLGKAYIAGIKWGLERDYSTLTQMDADLSHNPKYLPMMLAALEKSDASIGSRYIKDGGVTNWSWYRKMISRFGSWYSRVLLNTVINDFTGGFNTWSRKVFERVDVSLVTSEGYSFQIELKYRVAKAGFVISEIPIIFEERRAGKSKMSFAIVIEAIFKVWKIRRTV